MSKANRVMVMFKGPSGVVRAWASGPASDEQEVREVAIGKLSEYRKEKASLGDEYMATCDYTESTIGYVQ